MQLIYRISIIIYVKVNETEIKRLLEDSQKNYINTIEEHRKKNAYIEEYNKILRNLVYTQRQLILEYQKQLNIETIVDLYD